MKIIILLLALGLQFSALAYVPTVESLFRHGANPEVTASGVNVTFSVKKVQASERLASTISDVSLLRDDRAEDYYRIFFTKGTGDILKLAQTRYQNPSFSEAALEHKIYYPNFTSHTIRPGLEDMEKGLFYGVINSLILNDGLYIVEYLRSIGVPVRPNSELLNREKIELLASYKRYLVTINKDRSSKKTEVNPLRPEETSAKERVERINRESMYVDTKHVKLSRDNGQVAWMVTAGSFEAVFSYKTRDLQRIKYKSPAGDFEIICKDYWLANGAHAVPRFLMIKTFSGKAYQVEITNLRHYNEKEEDLVKRLNKWDQILKGRESADFRPEFLL